MKTIQKITLALLTVVSVSSLSAALEVNFATGAELESAVTGAVKFNGAGSLKFSGSASADAEVLAGNVQIASNNATSFTMTGGSLETTAAVSLGNMVMTSPANIVLGGAWWCLCICSNWHW